MTTHPNMEAVNRALADQGGLYLFADVVEAVKSGEMQSFSLGDSWVVTRLCEFPQKRVLSVEFAVGDMKELLTLEAEITGFAREHGAELIMASGRVGFSHNLLDGWKVVSSNYIKELNDGS